MLNKNLIALLLLAVSSSVFAQNSLGKKFVDNNKTVTSNGNTNGLVASSKQAAPSYVVNTITENTGTIVKQYIDINGNIFAISWKGPVPPNLDQLLGDYFKDYISPDNEKNHHNFGVHKGNLVVQNTGHMRAFSGMAYLKNMIPPTVDINSLQ